MEIIKLFLVCHLFFCLISCMKSACISLFMKIQIPRAVKRNTFLTQLQFFFSAFLISNVYVCTQEYIRNCIMTKCYSHFLPLTQIAAATFAQSWATFTKNILENKVTNLSAFWFIGNLTFYRKMLEYFSVWVNCNLNNNFPIHTGIKIQLKFKSMFIHSELHPFLVSNQKKLSLLTSIASSKYFFCIKKMISRLINPV